MGEDLSDSVRRLLDLLLANNKVWYSWHRTIYSGKTALPNEKLLEDELGIGINFRKAVETDHYV